MRLAGGVVASWVEDAIGGTRDACRATVEDVRVDHCSGHVVVAKEFLHGADVAPVLEEMGRERVAEGVRSSPFGEARSTDSLDHGALDDGLVQVMAAALPCGLVDVEPGGREGPIARATRDRRSGTCEQGPRVARPSRRPGSGRPRAGASSSAGAE